MSDLPTVTPGDSTALAASDEAMTPAASPNAHKRTRAVVIWVVVIAVVVVVAATVTFLTLNGSSTNAGYRFTSKQFDYAVTLPAKPTVTNRTTDSGSPAQRVQVDTGEYVATLEASKFPVAIPKSAAATALADAMKATTQSLVGTDAREQKDFSLGGASARSEIVQTSALGTAYIVVAVKGSDFFILIISHETPAVDRAITRSFTTTG